jgi:hypothetical protein
MPCRALTTLSCAGGGIGTSTTIALRALGASAALILFAMCAREGHPSEPDVRDNLLQTAATEVRVARVVEPCHIDLANPIGSAFSPRSTNAHLRR